MHPLKSNGIVKLSFSFSFAIRFAFTSLSSSRAKNWSSPKIRLANKQTIQTIDLWFG